MLIAQAAEDAEGFIEHNGDVLDIFLLVATILFLDAAVPDVAASTTSRCGRRWSPSAWQPRPSLCCSSDD